MITIKTLASSSSGNSTLLIFGETKIIVDIGLGPLVMRGKLASLNLKFEDIDAVFITHFHHDHFQKKTYQYMSRNNFYSATSHLDQILDNKDITMINDVKVLPIEMSHDSRCFGLIFVYNNEKVVYLTDSGYFIKKHLPLILNPSILLIESNYDYLMLRNSNRSEFLKRRIQSDLGHLSNDQSKDAIMQIIGDNTKTICLIHLSKECNTKEIAYQNIREVVDDTIDLVIADSDSITNIV